MKTQILTFIALTLFLNAFSQTSKTFESKPKNMSFIPQGNFQMQVIEGNTMYDDIVTVDAFWMSDEVTNDEYRKYVNYAQLHLNDSVCWVSLESIGSTQGMKISSEAIKQYTSCMRYSEIIKDIIDSTKMPYPDHFSNKKYSDYPVVGISQKQASFYCMWKTQMENDQLKKSGKPAIQNYRLPLEAEWMYVASQFKDQKEDTQARNVVNPSKSSVPNKWGLYNLADNVSEWTSSSYKAEGGKVQKDLKIIKGGAWTTTSSIKERDALDQNTKEAYIGFRIVRSSVEHR